MEVDRWTGVEVVPKSVVISTVVEGEEEEENE